MVNYKNGLIYTIRVGDSIYVGSTVNFNRRKRHHKCTTYNVKARGYNSILYKTIRENEGNFDMKPYKEFPCENKIQLTIEEEKIRVELKADLNMKSCQGVNKEKAIKNKKIYAEKNKEKTKQYLKEYYVENKQKILENVKNRELLNKEEIKKCKREYYHKNKETINKKTICECGCEVVLQGLPRHKKSAKHINLMEKQKGN